MVDQQLAQSFENIGEEYDRYRPGFPDAAAAEIIPTRVSSVLDLGAGTGKFTELLLSRADRVFAVEPSVAMLDVLRAKLPEVEAIVGGAEDIPRPDASVDAVTVAQAFHWFERDAACAEIARVLVPGGILGLLWNRADRSCSWDFACSRIVHPAYRSDDDEIPPEPEPDVLPGFAFSHRAEIAWSERITRGDYIARWLTVSSFLVADGPTHAAMLRAVEQVLDRDPETAGKEDFELPQITEVFVYRAA
ncbi:class I SAM-dependent methyltransferase [Microbacterium sp. A84]|uniref:class I SAM-dependent methyltransferase n=1 Tax=Microbacterium sp. A84 TaxID=3450715 RepID=UPI003F41EFB9